MKQLIYLRNDNVIEAVLRKALSGEFDTGASVSVTLLDECGVEISGAAWPMLMRSYGDGVYRAVLPHGLALRAGGRVRARVDALGSDGEVLRMWARLVAVERVAR